jgi:hypothetical protein
MAHQRNIVMPSKGAGDGIGRRLALGRCEARSGAFFSSSDR